jgi:hypothetical protein
MAKRRRRGVTIWKPRVRITSKGVRIIPPRAHIGGKVGVNVSKSGISASVRTKHGTVNTKRGCTYPLGCIFPFAWLLVGLLIMVLACDFEVMRHFTHDTKQS